jgi:hypothetical protein
VTCAVGPTHLEQLELHGDYWSTSSSDLDGEALWQAVCHLGLEASSLRNAAAPTRRRGATGSRSRAGTTGDTQELEAAKDRGAPGS